MNFMYFEAPMKLLSLKIANCVCSYAYVLMVAYPWIFYLNQNIPGVKKSRQELKGLVEKDMKSKWVAKASCFW